MTKYFVETNPLYEYIGSISEYTNYASMTIKNCTFENIIYNGPVEIISNELKDIIDFFKKLYKEDKYLNTPFIKAYTRFDSDFLP